jgi:hypothetical protein
MPSLVPTVADVQLPFCVCSLPIRSAQEKVAFAVHAVLAVNGARLLAVGDAADFAGELLS